jgi:ribonuclease P protein component
MLKKIYRLLGETKFDKKNTYNCPFFVLKVAKNESSFSRFGFIVSKKIDKRATVRNRIKRQIRVCIENNIDKIQIGYDMLFILKKQLLNKETKEIELLTMAELKKYNLLK